MTTNLFILFILAVTQIIGWGVVGLLPVIAQPIATEFNVSLSGVFIGTSVMYVAMGLAAPLVGGAFRRFGTRQVMVAGAALIGFGLLLLSLSTGILMFWTAWILIGLAGAMFLTTAAYAYLAEYTKEHARGLIGTLMLVTGLAGSVFWPVTSLLDHMVGWREACLIYAGVMILMVCPLVHFLLPATSNLIATAPRHASGRKGSVFFLLVATIAINSFVTFGIQAVGIQLLQTMGMDIAKAVAISSLLGIFKVGGRVVDLLGGRRWDGLSTGMVSGAMMPIGLAALWFGGTGNLAVGGYLVLFGVGSGAFAVARATMPLVFFESADYTAAMSTIALPMNLINALAPPLLVTLMVDVGTQAVFLFLGALSILAFAILWQLKGMKVPSMLAK
ncbi:MFS transporter [Rhizobium sp.]|jgi:MFS family permease|uniref:MFS transporter n=1 Tax=Rhizobium sp. TaxID=391 RepID=UPI000E82CDA3|nr:MFS transporter [Rhizobium sp.]